MFVPGLLLICFCAGSYIDLVGDTVRDRVRTYGDFGLRLYC